MITPSLDAGACALFLMATFVLSGIAQVAWLASATSRAFAVPLDGGLTFRGRRLYARIASPTTWPAGRSPGGSGGGRFFSAMP